MDKYLCIFLKIFKTIYYIIFIMEKNNNNKLFTIIIGMVSSFLWNFNTFMVNSENKFKTLYTKYSLIRRPTDMFYKIKNTISNYLDKTLKEPPFDSWSGLYQIDVNYKLTYVYQIKQIENIDIFNEHNHFYTPFISNFTDKNNVCVISKFNNFYKIFLTQSIDIETMTLSTRSFLSVFYKHPDMIDSIQLNIPNEMLLVGNELFNAAFILRCLKCTNEHFVFDKNYTIQIMDSEIDEYNIQYGHYLYINKDTFELKPI